MPCFTEANAKTARSKNRQKLSPGLTRAVLSGRHENDDPGDVNYELFTCFVGSHVRSRSRMVGKSIFVLPKFTRPESQFSHHVKLV